MPVEIKKKISIDYISSLLTENYSNSMKAFYEMQSDFLSTRYKMHKNIESVNILICFFRSVQLSIVRKRETNLDHNISLDNLLYNINNIDLPSQKIVSVVNTTGIPKETVRRKIKKLVQKEHLFINKSKEYYWGLAPKQKDILFDLMLHDINIISKFVFNITKNLNLNFTQKIIEDEIKLKFSFYFFHFLNCQLAWFKMWQTKIKDIDLIFIAMQVLIPTLKYNNKIPDSSISASSISEISGIPRPTCIRKLKKLMKLGLLVREAKTKRYYVNQFTTDRPKHIMKKENNVFTIQAFSFFLSILISNLSTY